MSGPGTRRGARPSSRPSTSRSTTARRAPRPAAPEDTGLPRPAARITLTGRAVVLVVVLCALGLSLGYPVQQWLSQRSQIARTAAADRAAELRVRRLQQEQKDLATPSYIEQQAREQLHDTFPGQQLYVVLPPAAAAHAAAAHSHDRATAPADPSASWYARLWASDTSAGA